MSGTCRRPGRSPSLEQHLRHGRPDHMLEWINTGQQLLDFLMKGYNYKPEMIDVCYNFAKLQYEYGNYSGASEYLYSSSSISS